jgi:glycosyltransferase involved in cell wall biosynthesis
MKTQLTQEKQLTLSVIIPCYNEVNTIEPVLERVEEGGLAHEIIIVDDGSTDGTRDIHLSDSGCRFGV